MALTDNQRSRRLSLTGARPFAGRKEKPPKARPPPGSQRTGRPASQAARQALYILITF